MKTLILIRHAKSSWADSGMNDFDRPLNERGKKDAPEMAERLLKKNIQIDAFVTSTANRARKTCAAFMEVFDAKKVQRILKEELYLAPPQRFVEVIETLSDEIEHAAIFAHNPGITEFANSLTNVTIDDMPTCAVFAVQAKTKKWSSFSKAEKTFLFFDYPKLS
jgi:phosphohistidine phosphatase